MQAFKKILKIGLVITGGRKYNKKKQTYIRFFERSEKRKTGTDQLKFICQSIEKTMRRNFWQIPLAKVISLSLAGTKWMDFV